MAEIFHLFFFARIISLAKVFWSPFAVFSCSLQKPRYAIERLRLTSQAVKHPQHSPFYFLSLIRLQGKKVVSSTVILETQAAWHLPSITVSTVTVAQLPFQLNWAATGPGVQVRQILKTCNEITKQHLLVANEFVYFQISSWVMSRTSYWMRIEFQVRGSPHAHLFWWIKGAPKVDIVEGRHRYLT